MSKTQYKFQKLRIYQLALQYLDSIYEIATKLPSSEKYNLKSQLERAGTSIVLNIAEGSTGLSNTEQRRFLSIANRSYLETIACFDICLRRQYLTEQDLKDCSEIGHELFISLNAMRNKLMPGGYQVREEDEGYMEQ